MAKEKSSQRNSEILKYSSYGNIFNHENISKLGKQKPNDQISRAMKHLTNSNNHTR